MAHQQQGKKDSIKIIAARREIDNQRFVSFFLLLALALCLALFSQLSRAAEGITLNNSIFVPDKMVFFNPLGEQLKEKKCKEIEPQMMDNDALYQAALDLQDNSINTSQRALNYQWLRAHHTQDNMQYGGRAFSKILKIGLQSYWSGMKQDKNDLVNVASTMADKVAVNDMRYNLKVSGNKLNLSVKYEF